MSLLPPTGAEIPCSRLAVNTPLRIKGTLVGVDFRGLPLASVLTQGNVNESAVFGAVMDELKVPRAGPGRPRRRPDAVLADKAHPSRVIRQAPRERNIRTVIPERADQKAMEYSTPWRRRTTS
ncbi:hypothetical protein GCM10010433_73890 [Streptomyces pulveraceus]